MSGLTYGAFIQEAIFDALGMEASGCDPGLEVIATGYTGVGSRWSEADHIDASVTYAAGALYSTVEDLYRCDRALYTGQLIPQALLDVMFTPYASTPLVLQSTRLEGSGYGWFIARKHQRPAVLHHGLGDGFVAVIERHPSDGVSLILLSNRDTTHIDAIADRIGVMLFGE